MAPLYSRYVPAKKSNAALESHEPKKILETNEKTAQAQISPDDASGRKKRKRSDDEEVERKARKVEKKNKKAARNTPEDGIAKPSQTTKVVANPRSESDGPANIDSSFNEREEQEAPAGDDEGVLKKHKKVLTKYQKAAEKSKAEHLVQEGMEAELTEPVELHDLVPIPQPPRARTPEYAPDFSALPLWLANPISVSSGDALPFTKLNLNSSTVAHLEAKGYKEAFSVQAALIPRLLPHPYFTNLPPNDLCVSAPTGSGKTLGYMLPIIESLRGRVMTKLSAIIVVPTRELVTQAQSVATMCAAGSGLKIATAVGNQNFVSEQEQLITKGIRLDPEEFHRLMAKAKRKIRREETSADEDQDEEAAALDEAYIQDAVRTLPLHVPTYESAADILICTPGRLVEHMSNTLGFSLDDVQWLVIDEADRLLDQSFQGWVQKVTETLERTSPTKYARKDITFRRRAVGEKRYVRKVILSATMTRDVAELAALRLRRPSLIVVKGSEHQDEHIPDAEDIVRATTVDGQQIFELPYGLGEHAVPVGDGSEKPLYLLELLRQRIIPNMKEAHKSDDSSGLSDTSSSEDSDSDSSIPSNSSSSDSDSDSTSDSNSSSSDSESDSEDQEDAQRKQSQSKATAITANRKTAPMILIFTASSEEASRLHHLLIHLEPSLSTSTTLLTKTSSKIPSALLAKSSRPRLVISTDRASRGLDLPLLTHVVNYTVPRSLESYIHRVGRTARAGRMGQGWTLIKDNEARWFWNEIARTGCVRRPGAVERVRFVLGEEWKEGGMMRGRYERVLEGMRELVTHGGRPEKGK